MTESPKKVSSLYNMFVYGNKTNINHLKAFDVISDFIDANNPGLLIEIAELWYAPDPKLSQPSHASKQIAAFLKMVRVHEGTSSDLGYRIMFTGATFDNFADHPRQLQYAGDLCSDAAGAYQFLSTTWDNVAKALELTDFSPANQDRAATELIKRRNAYQDVVNGNLQDALDKCSWEWASLPPSRYGQPITTYNECALNFIRYGGILDG